ncbi:MAG: hypothetical protein ACKPKO_39010, partial [Candidatus Fonsibacter sp.]
MTNLYQRSSLFICYDLKRMRIIIYSDCITSKISRCNKTYRRGNAWRYTEMIFFYLSHLPWLVQ